MVYFRDAIFVTYMENSLATAFIPYNAKLDSRVPRGLTAAAAEVPTRVLAQDIENVKALAKSDRPDLALRAAMLREREELHKKSMDRAQGWGNTIMGGRRQRLAAKAERQQKQEEERQRIDIEWAAVKSNERKAAVDRAKNLLHAQEPRIKQFHSALLLSNVLQERTAQVLQRRTEQAAQRAHDAALEATQVSAAQHAIVADAEAQIRARMATVRCGREQEAQARIRRVELARLAKGEALIQKIGDGVVGVAANGGASGMLTESDSSIDFAAMEAQAKADKKRAWEEKIERERTQRIALDEATALRRLEKQKAREAELHANAENVKFGQMKALFDAQRKQADTRIVRQRQHASEVAGKVAASEARKQQEAQDALTERLLHSHDGMWENRVEEERKKRTEALRAEKAFRIAHAAEVRERLKREKAEAEAARLQNLVEDAADVKEDLAAEKSRKALVDNLKLQHRQEIREHEANARAAAKLRLASETAALASADAKDADFDAYALGLIDEWRALGRDVIPLLHVLRQERGDRRPAFPIEGLAPRTAETDTFARLGLGYCQRSGAR
ncbi:hypothetical protein HDU88_006890 [Geranomyces variabilis]|nr:hypothetical protein HDU88_006890 [Geranomyces variabilis]